MAYLELSFFNSFDVSAQGKRIASFRSAKVAGLLVYLVLEAKTTHARDRLAALFWPDEPETRAKKNLRQTLYQLRKLVGETDSYGQPLLDVTRQTVQFNAESDTVLDVALFQAAVERGDLDLAENYYTGPLLPTFNCDSRPFDEWLVRKRHAFQKAALGSMHELAERQLALGGAAISRALALARRQLDLEPWREEAHRQLMRGLALSGDRSGAITQFDICSDVLAEELGVSPATETFALFAAIRDGTFPPGNKEGEAPAVPNNIPHQATPLVGRLAEITQLTAHLRDPSTRLITIVGPGGMGKTRLTLETARVLLDADDAAPFPSGIFLVELAATTSREEMLAACATAFGFALEREPEPQQQIVNFLANKQLLLLLDNVEQLIAPPASAAEVIIALLQAAPSLNILVTSHQKLSLTGERVLPLGGLALPDEASTATVESSDAMQLFAESARRVQPTFQLTDHNAPQVANICRLAAGMPLGILLSSAWSHLLTPAEIAAEMQEDVDFVAVDMADLPARQRSMRAVFDHTWRLLSPAEQQVLARLSVFRSGFTREAAQGVTGATVRQLLGLVDKSLLQRNVESGRFNLHELVRQLAAELLDKQGEAEVTEQAHSRYYLNWMSAQKSGLEQKGALKRLRKIGRDRPNFVSAWRSAVQRVDAAALLSTIPTYTLYVNMAGHEFEAHQLCLVALQQLSPGDRSFADTSDKVTYLRAVLLNTVQALGFTQVYDGERIDLDQLYTFFKTAGDRLQTGLLCQHLAFRALRSQDIGQAMAYFQRQIDIYEQEGERFRLGVALGNLGMMALFAGQTELSQQYMARALATLEQTDYPSYTAMVATHSGLQLMYEVHDYAAADKTFARATAAGMEIWSQGLSALLLLGGLTFQGLVALIQGDLPAARRAGQQMQKLASVRNHPTDTARSDALNGLIEATCGRYEDVKVDAFGQLPSGVERIGPIGTVLAAYGQGDVPRAVRTMIGAWSTPITLKWPALFLQYVPVAAAVLSDQGEYAQAAALIAMARQQPGCPHGWWEIMVMMQELEAKLQLALSAEEFAAAQAKGLEMDVQETATALLEQFRAMAV